MDVYFYMNFMDTITNSIIVSNFLVNIIDLKYRKSVSTILFAIMIIAGGLLNLKIIDILKMSIPQGMIFKPIAISVLNICLIYVFSKYNLRQSILVQVYYLIMGYSVELLGVVFLTYQNYKEYFTIFMDNSHRMLFAIMGNVTLCSVSMLYMLIYLKYKNKIKSNYIFLLLVLPILQIFTFQKYSSFLQDDVTIKVLVIGTVFFTVQIFMNIIVLNLVMKSILSYDLEKKVYMANLENEKNKYVRDLYTKQKMDFNKLIGEFKLILQDILDSEYKVKKNRFEDKNVFDQGLRYTINEADNLNNKIVNILDGYKENINNL
ncbi:MAG: hypothetical protein ACI3VR_05715 [Intestinibacter sp.]|uniref:hypothetical protein n=1 Tax=Intestinibacter sp. TaxID=1965304 RepID=UPI003F148A60